jgi:hypothetical protein
MTGRRCLCRRQMSSRTQPAAWVSCSMGAGDASTWRSAVTLPAGPPGIARNPLTVSACSKARPATSTGGRAALSGSATPLDAGPSGVLQTAILHVERSPRSDCGGGAQKAPSPLSHRRGRDRSQRANQTLKGNGRKKANRTGGCKERLRRLRLNVSTTHGLCEKRSPSPSVSLSSPAERAPDRSPRMLGRSDGVALVATGDCSIAPARLQPPDQATRRSRIGAARIKPLPPSERRFFQESLAFMSSHMPMQTIHAQVKRDA